MTEKFAKVLKEEIVETVKTVVAEIYQPGQIFQDLPEICLVGDLERKFGVTAKVIYQMANNGMPHTHVGREFRFHRSLLIEWTRGGEKPFPCATCTVRKKNNKVSDDDQKTAPEENYSVTNIKTFSKNKPTRTERLAQLV